jgi:hypothetical protein
MKSLTYAIILLAGAVFTTSVRGQSTPAVGKRSPEIAGEVERAGSQIQLVLTNLSDARAFEGSAKVSVGLSADTAIEITISLNPNETRSFPLLTSGTSGSEYSLVVYSQSRSPVLYKIAQIKTVAASETATESRPSPRKSSGEISVTPKLTRDLSSRDAEIPIVNQVEPFILTFEIESGTPVKDASFTLSAKDFQRRQAVTINSRADLEFKLPEPFSERKLSYALTSTAGRTLASGEVDLDQLIASDAASVSAVTFDNPSYEPGESARVVIEISGEGQRGYRLELTVKDGNGNFIIKDERRGSNDAGKSRQEFTIEIPPDAQGSITIDYRIFGGQTGVMSDSGSRQIIIKESQD